MNSLSTIFSLILKSKPGLKKNYHIYTIGVFGPVACGDNDVNSDVDIQVEFEKPIGIEFLDLANELEASLQQKAGLISRSCTKPMYFKVIEKDIHLP